MSTLSPCPSCPRMFAVGTAPFWPTHSQFVELLGGRESRHALLDQEGGDATRHGTGIRFGVNDQGAGIRAVGNPHLISVKNVRLIATRGSSLRSEEHTSELQSLA